jgi:hypothetical protein
MIRKRNPNELTQINNKPKFTRVFRYETSYPSNSYAFSRADMLNLQLAVTDSSTSTIRLLESVKLMGVKVSYFGADDDASTLCFRWTGDRSPDVCYTGLSTLYQPFIRMYRPPVDSLAGFYTTENSEEAETLFAIDLGAGVAYIDFYVVVIYADGAPSAIAPSLDSAATFTGIACAQIPSGASDRCVATGLTSLDLA